MILIVLGFKYILSSTKISSLSGMGSEWLLVREVEKICKNSKSFWRDFAIKVEMKRMVLVAVGIACVSCS